MITLKTKSDINWQTIQAVAYNNEPLQIAPRLLATVEAGRRYFQQLIEEGVACYGVTTGLGQFVTTTLTEAEQVDLPHNILRGSATAVGPPLPRPVVRAMMMIRLANFLSGQDGVSANLCCFLVDRLNDGFTPWVPTLGHGMSADVIAHTHAFQTLIGEGYVLEEERNGTIKRVPAFDALTKRGVHPIQLGPKEGLSLISGIAAAPAYALEAQRTLSHLLMLATSVAAISCEGMAVPKDSFDLRLKKVSFEPGIHTIIDWLQPLFCNSQIMPHKLQSAVSFRIIPQVHGALADALTKLQCHIEAAIQTFSGNPLMVTNGSALPGGFLSVGLFHNQHLVNQLDHVALALAHMGSLSVRRLHRLLSKQSTKLNAQLAARPGLDIGLVATQKAALGLETRLKILANPISMITGESSLGQEDYMSMAIPTISRLFDMAELVQMILAYELLGGLTALEQRSALSSTSSDKLKAGDGAMAFLAYFRAHITPFVYDRPTGPDVEQLLQVFKEDDFHHLIKEILSTGNC